MRFEIVVRDKRIPLASILAIISVMIVVGATIPKWTLAALTYYPAGKRYESKNVADHSGSANLSVSTFSFGADSIGHLCLNGTVSKQFSYNDTPAYAVNDALTIGYAYDGAFQSDNKDDWNVVSDAEKEVAGINLKKKIDKGTLIIRKSTDNNTWVRGSRSCYHKMVHRLFADRIRLHCRT